MDCPHCHAKNAFMPVYGAIGSSFNWDSPDAKSDVISGDICYACGHWIEPPPKLVESRPVEEPKAKIHKPVSAHRKIASDILNSQLANHSAVIFKLRNNGLGFREIAAALARKQVKVSYTKLRLWYHAVNAEASMSQAA